MNREYRAEGFVTIPFDITVIGKNDEEAWDKIVDTLENRYGDEALEYTVDFITEQ